MMGGVAEQGGPVAVIRHALGRADEGGAELNRRGAELERRRDPRPVHDAAGGDDRQIDLARKYSGQRHGPQPVVMGVLVEDAAMPASFVTLSHDGIDAGRRALACLGKTGCRG